MRQTQNITAIIYDKRGRVLSIGKNSYTKTHTLMYTLARQVHESTEKVYLHAEVNAILKCRELHNAHKILITRIKKDGSYGLAKPCKICERAIKLAGIEIVEHT